MKVYWTYTAQEHLDSIFNYVAKDSPVYALRVVDRLTSISMQIAGHPLAGRKVPEYDIDQIREVIENPYRIIYHIKPDGIDVLAVLHCAQNVLRNGGEE
jgi:addiction module RelE/StbE family toxin